MIRFEFWSRRRFRLRWPEEVRSVSVRVSLIKVEITLRRRDAYSWRKPLDEIEPGSSNLLIKTFHKDDCVSSSSIFWTLKVQHSTLLFFPLSSPSSSSSFESAEFYRNRMFQCASAKAEKMMQKKSRPSRDYWTGARKKVDFDFIHIGSWSALRQ